MEHNLEQVKILKSGDIYEVILETLIFRVTDSNSAITLWNLIISDVVGIYEIECVCNDVSVNAYIPDRE